MSSRQRHWDEDDVHVRPRRGKSRPRTKQRPAHADSIAALVVAVDRGRYTCALLPSTAQTDSVSSGPDNTSPPGTTADQTGLSTEAKTPANPTTVMAVTARELGRTRIVVGDQVGLSGVEPGAPEQLARIVKVLPRRSLLRRSADDTDPIERPLVAGCDQLVIVTAAADPLPRPRLIDRCLVAAYDAGLTPVLVITKTDLVSPQELLQVYGPLQLTTLPLSLHAPDAETADNLAHLRQLLAGQRSVCVGHSGVGKSTLVNTLVPSAARRTGRVNAVTGRGRHTSSSALALPLPDWPGLTKGGWIIDTPGVRSFGIAHVHPETIIAAFPELAQLSATCPRDCPHTAVQPDCRLNQPKTTQTTSARVDSLRRLLAARTATADN